jgi:hypothetical protein
LAQRQKAGTLQAGEGARLERVPMLDILCVVPMMVASATASRAPVPVLAPLAIMPAAFDARVGDALKLGLEEAAPLGRPLAWSDHPASWCFLRVAGSQENRDAVPGIAPGGVAGAPAEVPLEHAGVTMIGVDFAPTTARLTHPQLQETLSRLVTDEQRDRVLAGVPNDRPVNVRLFQSAKSLVRVGPKDPGAPQPPDAQTTGSKSGQFNEIRVLLDPLESLVGSDITVRFHAEYEKAAATRGVATNLDTGNAQAFVSDSSGIGLFHMNEPGRWRVDFTAARPAPKGDTADVVLYAATLTFATRAEVPK